MARQFFNSTVRITNQLNDYDGTAITDCNHEIKFYDVDGDLIHTVVSATHEGTGLWSINYKLPASGDAGLWRVVWRAYISAIYNMNVEYFEVCSAVTD